jgi:transposase
MPQCGPHTPALVIWLCEHGILPLYTPLGGSWLNMSESIQRILKRRALDGEHPRTPEQIITWFEDTTAAWNAEPTPFVWGGKRKARRDRTRNKRHALGGSGAYSRRSIGDPRAFVNKRRLA